MAEGTTPDGDAGARRPPLNLASPANPSAASPKPTVGPPGSASDPIEPPDSATNTIGPPDRASDPIGPPGSGSDPGGLPTRMVSAVVSPDPPAPPSRTPQPAEPDAPPIQPSPPAPVRAPPPGRAPARVATAPAKLRYRILPRTLLGISSLILALAVGAAFSGVVLYSYYQYRLDQTNTRVNTLINGYKQAFQNAQGDLKASSAAAQSQIQSQLGPLRQLEADPATLANLVKQLAPSLFFVRTLDANGQLSVGTAFVITSNASQSLLLTSYTTVAAATHSPAPDVFVRQGNTETKVAVTTWDTQYDLALIALPKGGLPAIASAPSSPPLQLGARVYALSGLGGAGGAVTQGTLSDVSASGVTHDAPIGPAFQGGPLVNSTGQVVAVASRTYAPLGFSTDSVWYAPYVQAACSKVLSCPNGSLTNSHN